jgi:outer membrane protein assembly complex protein YaeT
MVTQAYRVSAAFCLVWTYKKGIGLVIGHISSRIPQGIVAFLLICSVLTGAQDTVWIVKTVTFNGNESVASRTLTNVMKMHPSGLIDRVEFSFSDLMSDLQVLEEVYRNRGFFDVRISIDSIVRNSSTCRVALYLNVEEGTQFKVDSIVIYGNTVMSADELRQSIPLKQGSPFDSNLYVSSQLTIKDLLDYRGYMFSYVYKTFVRESTEMMVIVTFEIHEGPLVFAGDREFQGLEKVSPMVIERELQFSRGEKITLKNVNESVVRLMRTGLFNSLSIEPIDTVAFPFERDTVTVPVLILVNEADMLRLISGGSFSTDNGFQITLKLLYQNCFGLGHKVSTDFRVSSHITGAQLQYLYPWFLGVPVNLNGTTFLERRVEETFDGVFYGVSLSGEGTIAEKSRYYTLAKLECVNWITDPETTNFGTRNGNTALIGCGFSRDTRHDTFLPGTGSFLSIILELAGLGLHWSNNYIKTVVDLRRYIEILDDQMNFSSALFLGYVDGYGVSRGVVPAQELFRAGENDVRPVRGYEEDEVTPSIRNEIIGGRFALILNVIEFRFPLYRWFNGAVFVDAGNIWDDIENVSLEQLLWSLGMGIRMSLSVILARVDYGIKMDRDWDLDGRFHVSIGLPF